MERIFLATALSIALLSAFSRAQQGSGASTDFPIPIDCGGVSSHEVSDKEAPLKSTGGSSVSQLEAMSNATQSLKLVIFRCGSCNEGCNLGRLRIDDADSKRVDLADPSAEIFDHKQWTLPDGSISYNTTVSIPEGYTLSSGCTTCLD